jgi:hypothetical protein
MKTTLIARVVSPALCTLVLLWGAAAEGASEGPQSSRVIGSSAALAPEIVARAAAQNAPPMLRPKPVRREPSKNELRERNSPPPGIVDFEVQPNDQGPGAPAQTQLPFAYSGRLAKGFEGPRMGDAGVEASPGDPMIAAGPAHAIVVVNGSVGIYEKDGTRVDSLNHFQFFASGSLLPFDAKIIFDPGSQRFFVLAISRDDVNMESFFHIAVSTSADPMQGWFVYPPIQNDLAGNWVDYPGLGVSDRAVYFTGNYLSAPDWPPSPEPHTNTLWVLPKASLVNGQGSSVWVFDDFQGVGGAALGTLMPSLTYGTPAAVEGFLCSFQQNLAPPNPIKGLVWGITLPANFPTGAPTFLLRSVDTSNPGMMLNGPQLGGNAELQANNLGSPPFNALYRNGRVWTVTAYEGGGGTTLRYTEYNVAAWPTLSIANIGFHSSATRYYYWPAVTVNAFDDALLCFSGSSPNIYGGAQWALRFAEETSFGNSPYLRAGDDYYGYTADPPGQIHRWGDYGCAAVDPADQGFWLCHMYAPTLIPDTPLWATWVGYVPRAVFVDVSYGGTEAGTRPRPWDTVIEGHAAMLPGNDLVIRTGSYSGAVTLSKAGIVRADGGVVTIGQ